MADTPRVTSGSIARILTDHQLGVACPSCLWTPTQGDARTRQCDVWDLAGALKAERERSTSLRKGVIAALRYLLHTNDGYHEVATCCKERYREVSLQIGESLLAAFSRVEDAPDA